MSLLAMLGFKEEMPLAYAPGDHNSRASSPENIRRAIAAKNAENRQRWRRKYEAFCNVPVDHLRRVGAI